MNIWKYISSFAAIMVAVVGGPAAAVAQPVIGPENAIESPAQKLKKALGERAAKQRELERITQDIVDAQAQIDALQKEDEAVNRARQELAASVIKPVPDASIGPKERYKYAPVCRIFGGTPEVLAYPSATPHGASKVDNSINRFTSDCLGLTRRNDYDVLDLTAQFQANTTASTIDVVPSYTFRFRGSISDDRIKTSSHTFRLGVSIPLDKDQKSATFADLSRPNLGKEIGFIAGYEYGRVRVTEAEALRTTRNGLAAARRDCIAFHSTNPASDPLTNADAATVVMLTDDGVSAKCDGRALSQWMVGKGAQYYKTIIKPLWQPRDSPTLYVGTEGRYGKATRSFFPLTDPAGTGIPLLTVLPADFPATPSTVKRRLFSLKLYGGTSFLVFSKDAPGDSGAAKEMAVSGSISYRRDLQFPSNTIGQTVCPPITGIVGSCSQQNTAPPFELEGWVAGARLALQLPRLSFLPKMGIEVKAKYAFDVDQIGVEVPLYAFADAEEKRKAALR